MLCYRLGRPKLTSLKILDSAIVKTKNVDSVFIF